MTVNQIHFPKEVEVGKFYKVPCVRMFREGTERFYSWSRYVPVNSHLHEDKKVINFPFDHWHIDWRFISERTWHMEIEGANPESKQEVSQVIIYKPNAEAYDAYNVTSDPKIYYKRMKCKRNYQAGKFFKEFHKHTPKSHWVNALPVKFCKAKLKEINGQLICPHKGVIIDPNCKDEHGNYVCPGHLLRFDPTTLQLVNP